MNCERAGKIDFAAFAADSSGAEWGEFREHYPLCVECSREVAHWSRLDALLAELDLQDVTSEQDGDGAPHPQAEELVAFEREPMTLAGARRSQIETHLTACTPCRSELSVLRRFDMRALPTPANHAAEPGPSAQSVLGELSTRVSDFFRSLAPTPSFALAALVLAFLSLPVFWFTTRLDESDAPIRVAHETESSTADQSLPENATKITESTAAPAMSPLDIAQHSTSGTDPSRTSNPTPLVEPGGEPTAPTEPARIDHPVAPERVAETDGQDGTAPSEGQRMQESEPILLAALTPSSLPSYNPDIELAGGSLASIRSTTMIRSVESTLPEITALAPAHVGTSAVAAPTLRWRLSAQSAVAVEFVLIERDAVEPLLRTRIEAPIGAGIHGIDLSAYPIALDPNRTYDWSVALIPNEARRDRDIIANAAIRFVPPSPALSDELAREGLAATAHTYAEAGYWYDAFSTVSEWIAREPEAPRLRAHRDALLSQVGLATSR